MVSSENKPDKRTSMTKKRLRRDDDGTSVYEALSYVFVELSFQRDDPRLECGDLIVQLGHRSMIVVRLHPKIRQLLLQFLALVDCVT